MRSIREVKKLEGVTVLLRTSLNVPIKDGKVANAFRLESALPTIRFLRQMRAKVILIGHIGDKGTESLEPVYDALVPQLPGMTFARDIVGADARAKAEALLPGDVLMLENLRRDRGEKMNDPAFAEALASLADMFVQDSFDVCHRPHASVVGVPKLLPSYAGLQVELEVQELTKALKPKLPALAIIGGAKFATKEPVLHALLKTYDRVFVGGALANDFMMAKGLPVGTSLVSTTDQEAIGKLANNPKIALPKDYVLAAMGAHRTEGRVAGLNDVHASEAILDVGPMTVEFLTSLALHAETVLWNGPLGNYENGFTEGTEGLARAIATSSARTIVGGGDTIAAIEKLGLSHRFSFLSTGGGAMLDFLAQGSLPGIDALS